MKKIFSFLFIFLLSTGSRLLAYDGGKITDVVDSDYSSGTWSIYALVIFLVVTIVGALINRKKNN